MQDPNVWTDLSLLQVKQEACTLVSPSQLEWQHLKIMYNTLDNSTIKNDEINKETSYSFRIRWNRLNTGTGQCVESSL